jgi:hypothetical protein
MSVTIETTGVAISDWQPGALTKFVDQLLTELARAVYDARPNSPIARARDNLGNERFWTSINASLRLNLNDALWSKGAHAWTVIEQPEGKKQLVDDLLVAVLGDVVRKANLKGRAA